MDSDLQSKLRDFLAEPPEGVWHRVADALDADGSFAQRLFQYEEPPPADVWNGIEKDLDVPGPAKNVSFVARFKKPLRYAAAACIIAVVLVTVTLSIKETEAGAIEPGSGETVPTSGMASSQDAKTNKAKDSDNISVSVENTANEPTPQAVYSSLNEYVFFNDGDGKRRRVSKKLAGFVRCKDSDVACQQRLKQLRQKLAANAMTTDFTGLLEMMRQLQ